MILSDSHITQHHFYRARNTEINQIYSVMALRSFIISLIGIFIPIYLYNLGFGVQKIILFYFVMFLGEFFVEMPSSYLLTRFGPKHNIAFSMPLLILHFWLLWTIPQYNWNIYLIALTGSLNLGLFWQAYHYDFSKVKHKKKAGKEVSHMYILLAVLGAIAPFVGGEIASRFGFTGLFSIVIFLLLFAVMPLFRSNDPHQKKKFNLKNLKKDKNLIKQAVAYGASGIEASTTMHFWPLFIFFLLGTYEKIGFATSLGLVVTVIVTYFIGKKSDLRSKCHYIKIGSFLTGFLMLCKVLAQNIYHIIGFNLINSFGHSIYLSPFVAEYYIHADEESRAEYLYLMESVVDFARILFFGIMYLLGFYLEDRSLVIAGMLIGGFSTFFIALMPKANCEIKNRNIKVVTKIRG